MSHDIGCSCVQNKAKWHALTISHRQSTKSRKHNNVNHAESGKTHSSTTDKSKIVEIRRSHNFLCETFEEIKTETRPRTNASPSSLASSKQNTIALTNLKLRLTNLVKLWKKEHHHYGSEPPQSRRDHCHAKAERAFLASNRRRVTVNHREFGNVNKLRQLRSSETKCASQTVRSANSHAFGMNLTHFYLMLHSHVQGLLSHAQGLLSHAQGLLSHALAPCEIYSLLHTIKHVFGPGSFPKALPPEVGSGRKASLAEYRTRMLIGHSV